MNDIQILTLALTVAVTFLGVSLGVLVNNNRLTDIKDMLRAEIRAEGSGLRTEFRTEMASMSTLIERHHSEVMSKLIEMDNRILRLESQRLVQ